MLPSPLALTHGRFQIDVDASVFGDISAIHVFSASGDQQGVARLQGRHADVVFSANSGGLGRLPNVPVAEITVPVLANAPAGVTGAVAVQSPSPWHEVSGKQYTVSFQSPGVAIGAGISIQSVVPGGGQLPAGTVVAINGRGFTNSTRLQLDGVAWSNFQFINTSLLNITLKGPTDLTGKLFELTDGNATSTRYYSDLTPTSIQDDVGHTGYTPNFPAATYRVVYSSDYYLWFENDTSSSIDVVLTPFPIACTPCRGLPLVPDKKITVAAGGVYLASYFYSPSGFYPANGATVSASAPLRVLQGLYPSQPAPLPDLSPTALSPGAFSGPVTCGGSTVDYRVGDPAPQPIPCEEPFYSMEKIESLTAGTDDGNPWLHASAVPDSSKKFIASMDPAGLALGSHVGVVTAALSGAMVGSVSTIFRLNVHADATIAEVDQGLYFNVYSPSPRTITVTSTTPSVPITIGSTDSWLSVTPTSATTPATLTARMAPATPANKTATITIRGPGNSLALTARTYVSGILFGSQILTFAAKAGDTTAITSTQVAGSPFDLTVATDSGGNWLSAFASPPSGTNSNWTLTIRADPAGLAVGLYHGTVTVTPTSPTVFGSNPVPVSVTLSVWNDPAPPPAASPASLEISQPQSQNSLLYVSTGSVPLPFSATYAAEAGVDLRGQTAGTTPTYISVVAQAAYPGTYHGSVTITAPPGSANSVIVPVTLTVPPTPVVDPIRPKIAAIVNAGSMLTGSISPGEIVTVFGLVSSVGTAGLHIGSDGKVNRALYGNRVLFNGVAAPLLYMSSAQINAVVPYEIADSSTVTVEIDGGGVHSAPWTVPVAPSAPGLFTLLATGQGDAAILNQDNSLNTPRNPALRGSVVQMFLTGEGVTNPSGITGEVTGLDTKNPTQAVTVQIGGVDAKVYSASTAPFAIAGLFQVNAVVPADSPIGSVPVLVWIGNASSQSAATLSVR